MKYLLIGGAGYLGFRLAVEMRLQGHTVVIADLKTLDNLHAYWPLGEYVQLYPEDDYSRLQAIIEDCDAVFNLAGSRQKEAEEQPLATINKTVSLNWNLLSMIEVSKRKPAYVFLSSIHVYGILAGDIDENTPPHPMNAYALSKRMGEEVVSYFRTKKGVRSISIRLANSFGAPVNRGLCDWTTVLNDFAIQVVEKQSIRLNTTGLQERNFVTLEDTARAICWAAENTDKWPADGLLLIGSEYNTRIIDMARKIARQYTLLTLKEANVLAPQSGVGSELIIERFTFNVERLKSWGFTWTNSVEEEINGTLKVLMTECDY